MKKYHVKATLLKASEDAFTFVATDETLDRVGEVIPIESWDLANFKKNPVLLINHDYRVENIVGAAKNLRFEDGKMLFEAMFHEITQLSREVKDMVKQGFLNTVSVGFMRHGPAKDGDREHNELFEISLVPVPANPSAERLKAVIAKAADEIDKGDMVKGWVEKQNETTEVQTIICDKEVFETSEEAAKWCKEHDFKSDKVDETEDAFRFRQFDPESCQNDSFKTIDITDGVKGVICRPKKSAPVPESTEVKEGRVLSDRNRGLIADAISQMRKSIAALDDLLQATEPSRSAGADETKGREPKVVRMGVENEILTPVVRALQNIASITNETLRDAKKK